MKKLANSTAAPRKLTLRTETIGILRQLSNRDLRTAHIAGASA